MFRTNAGLPNGRSEARASSGIIKLRSGVVFPVTF